MPCHEAYLVYPVKVQCRLGPDFSGRSFEICLTHCADLLQGVRAAETLEQMGRLDCVHTSESFLRALGYAGGGAAIVPGSTPMRPLDRWDTAQPAGGPLSSRHRGGRRLAHGRGRRHSVADAAVAIARRLSSLQMWSTVSPEPTGGDGDGGDHDGAGHSASEAAAAAAAEAAAGHGGRARAPPGWVMAEVSPMTRI